MFVKAISAISPQKTHNLEFEQGDFQVYPDGKCLACEPNYMDFIPASALRRMGKAVRLGIGAAKPILDTKPTLDGIILSTANGGLDDCVKFLNQIVDFDEGVLTPTNFVQSTPNAVAGQLALMTQTRGYNNTHVNGSLAFETALIDAQLFFDAKKENANVLLGAIEEYSDYQFNIDETFGRYKETMVPNDRLFDSHSPGTICGEGATMFLLSNEKTDALAEIMDVTHITFPTQENVIELINHFLAKNNISSNDIDVLITGKNGDSRLDHWYEEVKKISFPNSQELHFKHFVGEYRTASAFGTYLAVQVLSNNISQTSISLSQKPKYALVYNHFDGNRHGFVLVKSV